MIAIGSKNRTANGRMNTSLRAIAARNTGLKTSRPKNLNIVAILPKLSVIEPTSAHSARYAAGPFARTSETDLNADLNSSSHCSSFLPA